MTTISDHQHLHPWTATVLFRMLNREWAACSVAIAICLFSFGCDLGTYSQRYNDRIGKMQSMAVSNKNLSKEAVAIGSVAKVRVPRIFLEEGSAKFGPSDDFIKARVPAMDFPGFICSYIADKESGGNWLPVQGYFYSVGAQDKSALELQEEVSGIVKSKLSSATARWENTAIEGYDGVNRPWSKMIVTGTQPFMVFEGGAQKQKNLTGRMDLYMTSSDSAHFMFVLRSPAEVFDEAMVTGIAKSLHDFGSPSE